MNFFLLTCIKTYPFKCTGAPNVIGRVFCKIALQKVNCLVTNAFANMSKMSFIHFILTILLKYIEKILRVTESLDNRNPGIRSQTQENETV